MEAEEQSDWGVGQDKGSVLLRYALRFRAPENKDFPYNTRITAGTLRNVTRITECNASPTSWQLARRSDFRPIAKSLLPTLSRTASLFGVVLGLAVLACGLGQFFQLRITLTDSSAPAGVYRQVSSPAGRGALVAACLPLPIAQQGLMRGYLREGDCPASAEPIAKVIGAVSGDLVDIEPDRVAVNGMRFANSRTAARDSRGRLLPHAPWGSRRVAPGEVWLFGFNNLRSWDARYFGAVPAAAVKGVLQPVVTW